MVLGLALLLLCMSTQQPDTLPMLPEQQATGRLKVLRRAGKHWEVIAGVPRKFRGDEEFVMAATQQNWNAFEYTSARIRSDRDTVMDLDVATRAVETHYAQPWNMSRIDSKTTRSSLCRVR